MFGETPKPNPRPYVCICDPDDLFDPPSPIPRAVEGCLAHQARYVVQNLDYEQGRAQQQRMVEHGRTLPAGYDCPDHPGPLDDARNHICRVRPITERLLP